MEEKESFTTRELEHYFSDLKEDVKEIRQQTTKTNGRVTKLERNILIIACVTGTLVAVKFPMVFDLIKKFI